MKKIKLIGLSVLLFSFLASCGTQKAADKKFYSAYSSKLGIQLLGKEDKKLIKTMADWKGTPYKYAGTSKKGTDCSGFVSQVYLIAYGKKLHRSSRDMVKDVKFISKKNLKAGDLLFYKIKSRKISHVAMYVGDNKMIHATTKEGVKVDDINNKFYKKYFYKAGRVKM